MEGGRSAPRPRPRPAKEVVEGGVEGVEGSSRRVAREEEGGVEGGRSAPRPRPRPAKELEEEEREGNFVMILIATNKLLGNIL